MEDLIGLLLFLVFAAISVIGNLAKKGGSEGSSGGTPSLKDILTTIKEELTGASVPSGKAVVDSSYQSDEALYGEQPYRKPVPEVKTTVVIPTAVVQKRVVISPEQLRQAVVWKEILDPPVSMR